MSEEKIDLSQFDEIADRVERSKAKAAAIRAAREGGAAPSKPKEAPADDAVAEEPAPEAAAPEESPAPAATAEPEVDLSDLDQITDRVARAKAKAEAIRKARASGGKSAAGGGAAPAKKAPAKKAAAGAGDRAAAARALTGKKDAGGAVQIVVQTSPTPPSIRPGPDRILPLAEGGMTTRRGFFSSLTLAWLGFAAATSAALAATGRFLFPNVLFEPPQSFKIGFPEDYDTGVDERWKDKFGVWVIKEKSQMYALLSICTHLGCTPNWLGGEQKFKCPCHGSGFYMNGINFEGPAPRPLERVRVVIAEDGQILVDKTQKYQYEKGQWENPESFLKLI